MYNLAYNTKVFKDVFPTYADFVGWYNGEVFSTGGTPSETTFKLIAYEFNDSHIAFSEDSFKEHFAIDLFTYYKEFEETCAAINVLMQMNYDEASMGDSNILNIANIPETEDNTSSTEVNFISQQQKNINIKNQTQVRREQISNKRHYATKAFLNKFRHLFIKILSPAYTFVIQEKEGE